MSKNPLRRPSQRRCEWCGQRFTPNGPNGAWPCCSRSCWDRLRANHAQAREREDSPLFAGVAGEPAPQRPGEARP